MNEADLPQWAEDTAFHKMKGRLFDDFMQSDSTTSVLATSHYQRLEIEEMMFVDRSSRSPRILECGRRRHARAGINAEVIAWADDQGLEFLCRDPRFGAIIKARDPNEAFLMKMRWG